LGTALKIELQDLSVNIWKMKKLEM
jgi:hypothetical protein